MSEPLSRRMAEVLAGIHRDRLITRGALTAEQMRSWIAQVAQLEAQVAAKITDPHPEDATRTFPVLIAAALILRGGKVLLERRAPAGVVGVDGMWDLPGGKVECGETPQEAIIREIREELGLEIIPRSLLPELKCSAWVYSDVLRHWIIAAYLCDLAPGNEPECHDKLQWFEVSALPENILTADHGFIQSARAITDTAIMDWLETHVSTIHRYPASPSVLLKYFTEHSTPGVSAPTIREASIAAMKEAGNG